MVRFFLKNVAISVLCLLLSSCEQAKLNPFLNKHIDYSSGMSWGLSYPDSVSEISFIYDKNKTNLIITIDESMRQLLPVNYRKLFFFNKNLNKYQYFYGEKILIDNGTSLSSSPPEHLVIKSGNPQKITINELADIVKNKNVLFYTGAGISANLIPDMTTLHAQLKFPKDLKTNKNNGSNFIKEIIDNPKRYVAVLDNFFKKCSKSNPTKAHIALAQITKTPILTENIDILHQKTDSVILNREDFYDEKKMNKLLNSMDFIITVGLKTDESGILKLYKKINKEGKIISINKDKLQNYLGNEDFIINGDIQEVVPELERILECGKDD